jgi:taurine dioxygenase
MEAIHDVLKTFGSHIVGFKPVLKNEAGIKKKFPAVLQPVVRVHEETGRKALYLSEGCCTELYDLEPEEGNGLLEYLLRHSVRAEYTYRHSYKVDDLILWDNRCLQHLAPPDYVHNAENLRHMYRLTVLGSKSGRPLKEQSEEFAPH